jgi:hypothetical protein
VVEDSAANIDYLNGIAAQGRDKQSAAAQRKMIETPLGIFQRDGFRQYQRLVAYGRFVLRAQRAP